MRYLKLYDLGIISTQFHIKLNLSGGTMKQSKYNISEYWRTKISQNEKFWSGLLENQAITQDSVIITPVILNSYSDQAESAWAVYPNPQNKRQVTMTCRL